MNMKKQTSHYPTEALFKGVKVLLTSLPSNEEKSELLRTLTETQSFLEKLRLLVETVPTLESSQELSEGLSRLDILADRANRDAGLRRLLGLRESTATRPKRIGSHGDAEERACKLEQELSQSKTSDIVAALEQSGEPLAVLAQLAARFGIRTRSKERKRELIKRIATHIENQRGYSLLRGDDSPSTVGAIPTGEAKMGGA